MIIDTQCRAALLELPEPDQRDGDGAIRRSVEEDLELAAVGPESMKEHD
jgi:hypothetical protein